MRYRRAALDEPDARSVVSTAGAKEEAVKTAKVQQLAAFCAAQAKEYWAAQRDLTELHGWRNRTERETLARQFVGGLPVADIPQADVTRECGRLLDA